MCASECILAQYNSWDGKGIKPNSHLNALNIFVNIIYDVNPGCDSAYSNGIWPPAEHAGINNESIPPYLLDFIDTSYNSRDLHGTITRLYGESSFDSLQIVGDFMVVNILESSILQMGGLNKNAIAKSAIKFINEQGGLNTIYCHNSIDYYDSDGDSTFSMIQFIIRNITKEYGGANAGSGWGANFLGNNDSLLVGDKKYPTNSSVGTMQCVGSNNFALNPTSIVVHEISHSLFGSNDFHTSGGNHRGSGCSMTFLNIQGGYGLMGAAGSGLVGCNGYERWRMHWKHPQATDYISAHNPENSQSVPSDICREDGNVSFRLRDFVTYGDAVRIKLPYKDSETSSNQYIWLENHAVGFNDKLDFLQYSNAEDCRPVGQAGIYAYYQVGRDELSGSRNEVWDSYDRDNLKVIPAEGYYDYELLRDTFQYSCVSYQPQYLAVRQGASNPLNGGQDQAYLLFPEDGDNFLMRSAEYSVFRKIVGSDTYDNLPLLGDTLDAFATATKINMGTNPSTCNTATCHSNNDSESLTALIHSSNSFKDTRTVYLSGLSIEMMPVVNSHDFIVNIRWDDYDIVNDARWTGTIALKEMAYLTQGRTITLAQNRTVSQPTRDAETGLFAKATRLTCERGSIFHQDTSSEVRLTEGSNLVVEAGSGYILGKGAKITVGAGCTLAIDSGADFRLLQDAEVEIDSGGLLITDDSLLFSPTARIIVRPGGKLVVDGGVLTSACDGEMWQGIFVEGDRTRPQTAANQGTVEFKNGAVIENAHCGITTSSPDEQWLSTGGIVYASDAIFRNNRKSVEFLSYEDILPSGAVRTNLSSFSNCTFTVDNNNHFDNMQTEFDTHVSLWDVNNVKFYGCTFLNTATGPSAGKHAVYAEDAGFSVLPSCDMPENTYYGCVCPESHATYCSFGGFAKAVSAATSGTSFHVSIDQARFADNAVAVEISGNNFVSVTRCDFDLQSAPGNSLSTVGLSLDNCTGYLVEENFFHRSSMPMFYTACGITIRNSGGDNNQLYRNSFSKLDFATRVSGSNFRLISGLTCSCNTYENNRYDIYLDRESSMSPIQGGQSKGADNTFSFTESSSLYNAGTQNIRYYHSHDRSMFPYAPSSSFTTYATAASNPCVSTLCNEGPQHPDYPRSPGGDFENLRARYDSIADAAEDMMLFTDNSSHSDLDRSSYAGGKPSASAMASDTAVSELFLMSQRAVRFFLNDPASDIPAVRNWLSRTPGTPSLYALAEAEFQLGADNTAVLSDIASGRFDSQADRDEYDNFVAFDILKRTLTDHRGQHGTTMASVNWPSATPGQIAELQRIAEARTGRSSVMAQGVLCFFFDLCSDDFLESEQTTDTRSAEAPSVQPSGDGLVVSPNPTEGVLRVEGDGDIASVELYDTFGRLLLTRQCDGPLCILDIAGLNDGAYLLKVRFVNGTVNSCKVVKK